MGTLTRAARCLVLFTHARIEETEPTRLLRPCAQRENPPDENLALVAVPND